MRQTLNGFDDDLRIVTPQGFRIRRANATIAGLQPSVDPHAVEVMTELDALLHRKIVLPKKPDAVKDLAKLKLTPRRVESAGVGEWAGGSLADKLWCHKPGKDDITLGDVIDGDVDLAELRYGFDETLDDRWNELDFNTRAVLGYSGVRHLLVLRAHLLYNIAQQASLMNFVLTHPRGAADVVRYAQVSAARKYVADRQLKVTGIDDDDSPAVTALGAAGLSLSADSLPDAAIEEVTDFRESSKAEELIKQAGIDLSTMAPQIRPRLIEYINSSPIPVTKDNAPFTVPAFLAKALSTAAPAPTVSTDDPFAVEFFVEDSTSLQVSTAAVRCAAQLYYVMVLGDELGVFDAVRYFTHRYLFRDGFAVEDRLLRRDLENYVFSEQFPGIDDQSGEPRMMRDTRPGERQSFYRQVFDYGKEPVPGDGAPNGDFGRLWKILMLESARYLEKAQTSPHPDSYVSRQNVMQAVEDLQYNLSTACVGMATVMTPLMYAELDFVVKRILGHKEVRKHIVPSGGSWWKVVERLQAAQGRRTRASVLFNKARIGYSLIRDIADYVPSRFEEDAPFAAFISNVDAFITTQAILQEEASQAGKRSDTEEGDASAAAPEPPPDTGQAYGEGRLPGMPDLSRLPGMPSIPGASTPWPGAAGGAGSGNGAMTPVAAGGTPASDEWDF